MSEYAKTNQIFKIEKPKDVFIREDLLVVLDSNSNIHIKDLCTVPSFLGDVFKITLRGDFLYLISKDTTIAILNILDMSIIGVYKNINEVISIVIFGNRHIHIITENLLYYKTSYENIKFKRVDCHEKEDKYHFNGLYNNSLKNPDSKLLLMKMLSISPNDESIVYLDVYGTLYHNKESILSFIETVKYIYTTSDKLFLIIDTCLVIYDLNKRKIEDKREIGEIKLKAGPFVVVSNQIINILDKKEKSLPFQFEEIFFQNNKVYGLTNEGIYEIEMF